MELVNSSTLSQRLYLITGIEDGFSNSKSGVERDFVFSREIVELYLLIQEFLSLLLHLIQIPQIRSAHGVSLCSSYLNSHFGREEGVLDGFIVLDLSWSRYIEVVDDVMFVLLGVSFDVRYRLTLDSF